MLINAKLPPGKEDEQEREIIATTLCAAVYLNGKVDGRFQMPRDYLSVKTGLTPTAIAIGLSLAELRDWVGLSRRGVALKAAGIYVAKSVLGLPR
jgi:hypothetical protein